MSTTVEQSSTSASSPKSLIKRISSQGVQLKYMLIKSAASVGMLLGVWLVGYFRYNVTWVLVPSLVYVGVVEYRKARRSARRKREDEQTMLGRVDELPSWVLFPDVERAEWLNKIIKQMWPFIGKFVKNTLKTTVESRINELLPSPLTSFQFQTIDMGSIPPRIGGVKVYIDNIRRNEVIMDMEILYAGDSQFQVSVTGIPAGIKDVQVTGSVRVIMKPLVNKVPIIAAVTIYFLRQPNIDFDLTQVADVLDIPLLSTALRTIATDEISNHLVFPNKITVPLMDDTGLASLLFRMPKAVLQLFVEQAADLRKADVGLLSRGSSDPFCKISVGSRVERTEVFQATSAPVWNKAYEFIITDETAVNVEVYDEDPGNDDFLGRKAIDFETLKLERSIDNWFDLAGVDKGRIKLSANWKQLNNDPLSLTQAKLENESEFGEALSVAILLVVVDSARKLPLTGKSREEPSPYVVLQLGNKSYRTGVKEESTNPTWEEQFEFLCDDPTLRELNISVMDDDDVASLGVCTVPLSRLLDADDMTSSRPYPLRDSGTDTTVTLHLCLRMLTSMSGTAAAVDEEVASTQASTQLSAVPLLHSSPSLQQDDVSGSADPVKSQSAATDTELRRRVTKSSGDGRFGRIQLTVRYSVQRSQLVIVVHQCRNLIACDSDNLADPYVRLYLGPDRSSSNKRKTQTHKNSLSPVYDETFEWPVAMSDIASHTIELMVKNSTGVFSNRRVNMGQLLLDLSQFDDLTKASTEWYDLEDPDSAAAH